MAGVILNGSTSGSVTLDPPAEAGSTVITLPSTSGTMLLSNGDGSGLTNVTAGTATTATNLSGGSVSATTGTFSGSVSAPGVSVSSTGLLSLSGVGDTQTDVGGNHKETQVISSIGSYYGTEGRIGLRVTAAGNNGAGQTDDRRMGIGIYSVAYNQDASCGAISIWGVTGENYNTTQETIVVLDEFSGGPSNALGYGIVGKARASVSTTNYGIQGRVITGGGVQPQLAQWVYNSTTVGAINTNGSTTTYSTTSDYRLKENIQDIENGLANLLALRPLKFNFISTPNIPVHGFLAHEVQAVIPEAVTGEKDASQEIGILKNENGDILSEEATKGEIPENWTWEKTGVQIEPQMLDQSKIIPIMVKAIQEQQALIENLTTRLSALENK